MRRPAKCSTKSHHDAYKKPSCFAASNTKLEERNPIWRISPEGPLFTCFCSKSRPRRTIAKPASLARTFNKYLENTKGIGEGVRGDELPGKGGKPPSCLTTGMQIGEA